MKTKDCYNCKNGYHDAGGWVWCQRPSKLIDKMKYYRGDNCGGCKYYKKQR